MLAQPTGEPKAAVTAPESGELNSPHERLRRTEGSGMFIGDPLW